MSTAGQPSPDAFEVAKWLRFVRCSGPLRPLLARDAGVDVCPDALWGHQVSPKPQSIAKCERQLGLSKRPLAARQPSGRFYSMRTSIWRVIAWGLFILVTLATLSPIGLRPQIVDDPSIERALALLLVGITFGCGYPRRIWLVGGGLLLGIGCLEWSQQLLVDRHGRLDDAAVKSGALIIGLGIGRVLARRSGEREPQAR